MVESPSIAALFKTVGEAVGALWERGAMLVVVPRNSVRRTLYRASVWRGGDWTRTFHLILGVPFSLVLSASHAITPTEAKLIVLTTSSQGGCLWDVWAGPTL